GQDPLVVVGREDERRGDPRVEAEEPPPEGVLAEREVERARAPAAVLDELDRELGRGDALLDDVVAGGGRRLERRAPGGLRGLHADPDAAALVEPAGLEDEALAAGRRLRQDRPGAQDPRPRE